MDVESAKDICVEDGKFIVFTETECKIYSSSLWESFQRWTTQAKRVPNQRYILNGAYGVIRPGRLTFILGPSGAGKTTLLKILAGRKKQGVTGCLHGAGKDVVLVSQNTTLIDTLTARETLNFAARLKLPHTSSRERQIVIGNISKQLGIHDVLHTKAGHISGGERKRLVVACELLTDPHIILLDEPTSGLDSVSCVSVMQVLRTLANSGRTVACVLHQPSSKLYTSADDIILMANGRTLYAGATSDIPSMLARGGFACPPYYNMADYLLEVASGEHVGNLSLLETDAKSYAYEMNRIVKNGVIDKNDNNEREALLNTNTSYLDGYKSGWGRQLFALLGRACIGSLRDVHLTQIRLASHLVVALLLGALYNGAGAEANRIMSNTACLFFFLLFLFFANAMPTIHTCYGPIYISITTNCSIIPVPAEATVVLQEHLNRWYSLSAYCISKIVIDLPTQLLCATIFLLPAWYLTSQPWECHRLALAWVICALVTILAQTFGLVIGAACGVKLGLFVVPASNIPMLMFSEFFIPYHEMPAYLRPFAHISYFRYGFDAIVHSAYGLQRQKMTCLVEYCMFKDPARYLKYLGMNGNIESDIYALVIWIVLLQISFIGVLVFRVYRECR